MDFPELNRITRDREYNLYSSIVRKNVVYAYLFEGFSHRALDEKFIGLDSIKSKGYQAMGILHFLGLRHEHKNFFNGVSLNFAISVLEKIDTADSLLVANNLKQSDSYHSHIFDAKTIENEFQNKIESSKSISTQERQKKLKEIKNAIPERMEVISVVFKRNPDVVIEVLNRANGFCEHCNKVAPFLRAKDGSPYLEVHHTLPLSDGGKDIVENAVALCPNCHRKAHYGMNCQVSKGRVFVD